MPCGPAKKKKEKHLHVVLTAHLKMGDDSESVLVEMEGIPWRQGIEHLGAVRDGPDPSDPEESRVGTGSWAHVEGVKEPVLL